MNRIHFLNTRWWWVRSIARQGLRVGAWGCGLALGGGPGLASTLDERLAQAEALVERGEIGQAQALVRALRVFQADEARLHAWQQKLAALAAEPVIAEPSPDVKKAADGGDRAALRRVYAYQEKHGTLEERIAWLKKLAEAGAVEGQRELALRLIEGRGMSRDLAAGEEWFDRAARQSETISLELAEAYVAGVFPQPRFVANCVATIARDPRRLGPRAQYLGARLIQDGMRDPQTTWGPEDARRATGWLLDAAQHGEREAFHPLAESLRLGRGAAKDPAQAMVWYRKALDVVGPEERIAIARRLIRADGVTRDVDTASAVVTRTKPETPGLQEAYYELGMASKLGTGTTKDQTQACRYFQQASSYPPALYELALAWRDGLAPDWQNRPQRDLHEALRLMQQSADAGHGPARTELAALQQRAARFYRPDEAGGDLQVLVYEDSTVQAGGSSGRIIYEGRRHDVVWINARDHSVRLRVEGKSGVTDAPVEHKLSADGRLAVTVVANGRVSAPRALWVGANVEAAGEPGRLWVEMNLSRAVKPGMTSLSSYNSTSDRTEIWEAEAISSNIRPIISAQTIANGVYTDVGSDSNTRGTSSAKVRIAVPAGQMFRVIVESSNDSGGNYELRLRRLVPLTNKAKL